MRRLSTPVLITFICFYLLFPTGLEAAAEDEPPPRPHAGADMTAAMVNGRAIKVSELIARMQSIGSSKRKMTRTEAVDIKQEALDQLITEELVRQQARQLSIGVAEEEIRSEKESLRSKLETPENYENFLQDNELTDESLTRRISSYLTTKKLMKREIEDKVSVTPEDIASHYEATSERFVTPEQVKILDIVFFLDADSPESMKMARNLRGKIIDEYAGDPLKVEPDHTFVIRDDIRLNKDLEPELYATAKKLSEGEISEVVAAAGTLHLLKLVHYAPRVEKPLEEVERFLEQELYNMRKEERRQEWMAELKENASIEIMEISASR